MSQPSPTLATTRPPEPSDTRLYGRRLVVVRMLVVTAMTVAVGSFVLALPSLVPRLATPCADALTTCMLAPQQVAPLAKLGITPHALALAVAALSCLGMLLVSGVAAVLVWRRSDDWMALLVALTFVLLPLMLTPVLWGLTGVWQVLAQGARGAGFLAFVLLVGLFPSGRFVPRWLWLPVVAGALVEDTLGSTLPQVVSLLLILCIVLSLSASQIYRYRRLSTPVQRQQTKWAVYGFVLTLLVNQLFWQTYGAIPALHQPASLYALLAFPDAFLMIAIVAVFFGVAILRSRLFNIDVIIRRTLVYGTLTAVLAAVYFALVISLQALVGTVNRAASHSPVIVVASTLLIAALFNPVRRRTQATIDRRFYRRRYDAAQTVATFGATLRSELDLAQLSAQLLALVEETIQPSQVTLWLVRPTLQHAPAAAGQRADAAEAEAARIPKPVPLSDVFAVQDGPTR
jgi:hypothetical protein